MGWCKSSKFCKYFLDIGETKMKKVSFEEFVKGLQVKSDITKKDFENDENGLIEDGTRFGLWIEDAEGHLIGKTYTIFFEKGKNDFGYPVYYQIDSEDDCLTVEYEESLKDSLSELLNDDFLYFKEEILRYTYPSYCLGASRQDLEEVYQEFYKN